MTNDEARAWLVARFGASSEKMLSNFADLLIEEAEHQNLVSRATIPEIWVRHLADSAQLVDIAVRRGCDHGHWIDIGSGAGLPGLVVAMLWRGDVTLIEPRKGRVSFLQHCIGALDLANVRVEQAKVERFETPDKSAVLSARAVSALPNLLQSAKHLANDDTLWILPKGASADSEVEAARKAWQGSFHVEQSITHPLSQIVVAARVAPR